MYLSLLLSSIQNYTSGPTYPRVSPTLSEAFSQLNFMIEDCLKIAEEAAWGLEKWRVMHREVFMLTVGRHRRKPWVSIRRENKDEFQNHAVERVIGI